jgi:predicted ester cyclase
MVLLVRVLSPLGRSSMATPEDNKEIVRRTSFEPYAGGDMDVIDELVSEEYVLHDPNWPEEIRGRDGLRRHAEALRSGIPDLSFSIDHMTAEGDLVSVHFTARGTNEGSIPELGIEPSGREIEVVGMEFDRIEDGKLAETWIVIDALGLMGQLDAGTEDAVA